MVRPILISVAIFTVRSHGNQFLLAQVLSRGDESTWMLAQRLFALSVSQGHSGLFAAD
ncbi:hypothetical protein KBX71_06155 [Micromonospora sp. D93]|uniref:hypothetical protein n=1 Tax=Micromonospora sp. D93 TaxID=2824886 RepID=UPI001B37A660|nr:hypothetical protein [Micromonospora sp. D93]MBQ1017451.1 hypothetical protein [Micromonospora sp. D93]